MRGETLHAAPTIATPTPTVLARDAARWIAPSPCRNPWLAMLPGSPRWLVAATVGAALAPAWRIAGMM
jgi:hypothetical protein